MTSAPSKSRASVRRSDSELAMSHYVGVGDDQAVPVPDESGAGALGGFALGAKYSAVVDLAALEAAFPAGQGGAGALPFDLNLRLQAETLLRGDIRASDTVLEVGAPPDCAPAAGR